MGWCYGVVRHWCCPSKNGTHFPMKVRIQKCCWGCARYSPSLPRDARPARQTFKTARCKTLQIRILHLAHGALFLPDLDFTLVKCVFACKGGAFQSVKRAAIVQALQATFEEPNKKALKDSWEELCGSLPERLWRTPGRSFPKHLVKSSKFRLFNFRIPLEKAFCCQKQRV